MKKFALCGPSGVGKGYVSSIICSNFGLPVLDTDRVVHTLYREDKELISTLADIFGNDIISDGEINRKALGAIVFSNPEALKRLNLTVHKRVREYILNWFDIMEKEGHSAAFADIPQIIESGMISDFDLIITVSAREDIRLERILSRDGICLEDAKRRISNQLSMEEYEKISDHIIYNNGEEDVTDKLEKILTR